MHNFLYLIQDINDIGTNIYKIGKTNQLPDQRFKGYEKGSYPFRISKVDNCNYREKELINIFKEKYELARGREYFRGDLNKMIEDFNILCDKSIFKQYDINNNEIYLDYSCDNCAKQFYSNELLIFLEHNRNCNEKSVYISSNLRLYDIKQLIKYVIDNIKKDKIYLIYKYLTLSYTDINDILNLNITDNKKIKKLYEYINEKYTD